MGIFLFLSFLACLKNGYIVFLNRTGSFLRQAFLLGTTPVFLLQSRPQNFFRGRRIMFL